MEISSNQTASYEITSEPKVIGEQASIPRRGQAPLLIVKHQERLDAIRTRLKASTSVSLKTSICARHIRRDFNIASAKMYVFGLNRNFAANMQSALDDMEWSLDLLATDAAKYSYVSTDCLSPNNYDLDVVSAESAQMLRVLKKADSYLSRLYAAELLGIIERDARRDVMRPFWMTYAVFKRVAMKTKAKTMDEMLSEVCVD